MLRMNTRDEDLFQGRFGRGRGIEHLSTTPSLKSSRVSEVVESQNLMERALSPAISIHLTQPNDRALLIQAMGEDGFDPRQYLLGGFLESRGCRVADCTNLKAACEQVLSMSCVGQKTQLTFKSMCHRIATRKTRRTCSRGLLMDGHQMSGAVEQEQGNYWVTCRSKGVRMLHWSFAVFKLIWTL